MKRLAFVRVTLRLDSSVGLSHTKTNYAEPFNSQL
jgi:hypothetical protein